MAIQYVTGDATVPMGDGPRVILHCCNDVGLWGSGFVLALSRRWPEAQRAYFRWYEKRHNGDTPFELGKVQFVLVDPVSPIWVANMIGQRGIRGKTNPKPVQYSAILRGLDTVHDFCVREKASVHAPRFGAGLASGSWDVIEGLINEVLAEVPVTIYDLA